MGSEIASRLSHRIQRPLAGGVEILIRINRGMSSRGNSSASNSASAPVGRISRRLAAKNAGYAEKRTAELEVATALAAQKAAVRAARNPVEIARALCNAYLSIPSLQALALTFENRGKAPLDFYNEALAKLSQYDPEFLLNPKQERAVRTILLLLIASHRGEAPTKSQIKIASDKVGSARLEEFLETGEEQDRALVAERGGLTALFPYYQGVMERISSRATTRRPNGKEYTQGEKLAMIETIEKLLKPKTSVEKIQENVDVIEGLGLDEEDFKYANTMLIDDDPVAAEIAAEEGGESGGEGGGEGGGAMVEAPTVDPRAVFIYQCAKHVLIHFGLSQEQADEAAEAMGKNTLTLIASGATDALILETNRYNIVQGAKDLGASEADAERIGQSFVALLTGEGGMEGGRRRDRRRSSRKSRKTKKSKKVRRSSKAKKSKKSRRTHRK